MDLIKAVAILLDTTVRRSAVDSEDLKPYWKSEKRPHFSRWSTILFFRSFSKTLLTKERGLTSRPSYLGQQTTNFTRAFSFAEQKFAGGLNCDDSTST